MLKSSILNQVEEVYKQGGNIIRFINEVNDKNSKESILISYDYQAGSYVLSYKNNPTVYHRYIDQLSDEIRKLGAFNSILEAGIGEATTFKRIIQSIDISSESCYGFDISWSRLKVAKEFLKEDITDTQRTHNGHTTDTQRTHNGHTTDTHKLFVADLSAIPLCDNAIDVVYTAHSIEPNGGYEMSILQELYRVTKKFLVLFEPDYELAGVKAKKRMDSHGYAKNLATVVKSLGYNIIKHELLPFSLNELNPTSVIVIDKSVDEAIALSPFQCPLTKTSLIDCGEVFFAPQPRLMYPVIKGIPCLLDSHAILGCKYTPDLDA